MPGRMNGSQATNSRQAEMGRRFVASEVSTRMGALITFARNRMAYTSLRSLSRRGIRVVVGDSFSPSMCFYSRYCHDYFIYPSPYLHPERFIDALIRKAQDTGCRVILPMHEEGYVISKYRDRLSPHLVVPLSDHDRIMTLHSKERFYHLSEDLGLPIPKTYLVGQMGTIEEIAETARYPVVVKPRRAHGAFGLRYAKSPQQLLKNYRHLVKRYGYRIEELPIVQEYVGGIKHSVCTLFNRGRLRALCMFRFLREFPIQGGTAVLRISVKEEQMEQIARRALEHLEWHGIAEAEFTLTQERGPVLMEINPRFWGSLYQGVASGVDFPYLLYRMAVDGDIDPVLDYPLGVKTRWLWGDWRALCDYVRHPFSQYKMLLDYLKFYRRDVTYDDYHREDPLPFLVEMVYPFVSLMTRGTFNPVEKGSEYDRER
jgi:predicted ATP-grasp superfamily ATP-dependent carboligase